MGFIILPQKPLNYDLRLHLDCGQRYRLRAG
jgi:hypothetical protein